MRTLEIHPLGDLAAIERNTIAPSAIQSGTTYVGLENIESDGGFKGVKPVDSGDLASSKFRFTNEHILFGKLRPYLRKIAAPNFSGICSTDILPIKPGPRLDRRFLLHYLRQPGITEFFSSQSVGVNLPRVSPKLVAAVKIPLPPLPEQRRIADILDRAEALQAKRRSTLAQLDELTRAIFLDMFGGQNYQSRSLDSVVRDDTIVTYGIVQAGEEYPEGVPYIRTGDIVGGEVRLTGLRHTDPAIAARFQRSRVEAGEIVMSIRATVGTCALVPPALHGANLTQGTARISPGKPVNNFYLLHFIRSDTAQQWIERETKGITFREITLNRLRQLPVPLPPLSLQQEFARRVQAIDRLKTLHRQSLAQLDALFQSLQHRAFRGEL